MAPIGTARHQGLPSLQEEDARRGGEDGSLLILGEMGGEGSQEMPAGFQGAFLLVSPGTLQGGFSGEGEEGEESSPGRQEGFLVGLEGLLAPLEESFRP